MVVRPRSIVCSASSSVFFASNRMMPSEVVRAQALTHLPPTKFKLSNALPGGGAGSAINFSRSGTGAWKVGSADLPSTSSALRSVPAACWAAVRWALDFRRQRAGQCARCDQCHAAGTAHFQERPPAVQGGGGGPLGEKRSWCRSVKQGHGFLPSCRRLFLAAPDYPSLPRICATPQAKTTVPGCPRLAAATAPPQQKRTSRWLTKLAKTMLVACLIDFIVGDEPHRTIAP